MKNKFNVAIGAKKPKDLSKSHYTTMAFGELLPVYQRTVIPGQKLKVDVNVFGRTAPMYLPTLSSINLKNHAFYVPYRYVWKHFDNFINGLPSYVDGTPVVFTECPFVEYKILSSWFFHTGNLFTEVVSDPDNKPFDIAIIDLTDTPDYTNRLYYKFTNQGRYFLHILNCLGYNFNFMSWFATTEPDPIPSNLQPQYSMAHQHVNMLPLLSYLKVYLDYYVPSQLQPTNPIRKLLDLIEHSTSSDLSSDTFTALLLDAFNYIYKYYQNNYFTSAWLYPNAPVDGLNNFDNGMINSISSQDSDIRDDAILQPVQSNNYGVNSINSEAGQIISQDGLTFLQKFNRFIKRNMYAGSRAVERIKARFGVDVDDFDFGMSKYYGSQTIEMNKQEVVNTSNSENSLGEYAGKGWIQNQNNKNFTFDCDLHGHVFIITSIDVPSTYVDGIRRFCLNTKPLDFYTPEFDGTILQAISGAECLGRLPFQSTTLGTKLNAMGATPDMIYGYISRFAEYKTDFDDVTGDFAIPRLASEIDGFVLPRRIINVNKLMADLRADPDATMYSDVLNGYFYDPRQLSPINSLRANDIEQFYRIFKDLLGNQDPFFCKFTFNVLSIDGMLPLDESNELQGRGKQLEFESNGIHIS